MEQTVYLKQVEERVQNEPILYSLSLSSSAKLKVKRLGPNGDMENRLEEDHKLSQGTYGPEKH